MARKIAYVPRPPIAVACFMAALAHVTGNMSAAESYILDLLTLIVPSQRSHV